MLYESVYPFGRTDTFEFLFDILHQLEKALSAEQNI